MIPKTLGFRVQSLGARVYSLGFRISGLGVGFPNYNLNAGEAFKKLFAQATSLVWMQAVTNPKGPRT